LNGFSLENISQLKKITAFSSRDYNVLHCIADIMEDTSWLSLSSVLSTVDGLLEFEFSEMLSESLELENSINEKISLNIKNKLFYEIFLQKIDIFIARVSPMLVRLAKARSEAESLVKEIRTYFGESEKKSVNEIFLALRNLRIDLHAARIKRAAITSKMSNTKKIPAKSPKRTTICSPLKTAPATPAAGVEE
jgi:hypothetical protein